MATNNKKEIRLADVHFEETEGKMILEGYALVFEQETLIGDEENGFIEVVDRNALVETVMRDVPMKYNHMDSFLIIARTKNNSLILTVDNIGLKVHAELLDTHSNEDVYKMVRAELLDKMSFAFVVSKQSWDRSKKTPIRRILGIGRLYDVSIVDIPAYEGTTIYARSLELVESTLKAMDLEEHVAKAKLMKQRIKIKSNI